METAKENFGNYQKICIQQKSHEINHSFRNGNYVNLIIPPENGHNNLCTAKMENPLPRRSTENRPAKLVSGQAIVKVEKANSTHEDSGIEFDIETLSSGSSVLSNFNANSNGVTLQPLQVRGMQVEAPKKRGRKKRIQNDDIKLMQIPILPPLISSAAECLQNRESKEQQVLKAAKSLFSKRTRTLYHWMYPSAPKQQLKMAVSNSWETLGSQEKEFYISQVLGRFGFPQCNLMVNPQLGGLPGIPHLPPLTPMPTMNDETKTAVSSILLGANVPAPPPSPSPPAVDPLPPVPVKKPKRRLGRPPGSKNKKRSADVVTVGPEDGNQDEFQDDPELNREFQQFKWAFHMTNKNKF